MHVAGLRAPPPGWPGSPGLPRRPRGPSGTAIGSPSTPPKRQSGRRRRPMPSSGRSASRRRRSWRPRRLNRLAHAPHRLAAKASRSYWISGKAARSSPAGVLRFGSSSPVVVARRLVGGDRPGSPADRRSRRIRRAGIGGGGDASGGRQAVDRVRQAAGIVVGWISLSAGGWRGTPDPASRMRERRARRRATSVGGGQTVPAQRRESSGREGRVAKSRSPSPTGSLACHRAPAASGSRHMKKRRRRAGASMPEPVRVELARRPRARACARARRPSPVRPPCAASRQAPSPAPPRR